MVDDGSVIVLAAFEKKCMCRIVANWILEDEPMMTVISLQHCLSPTAACTKQNDWCGSEGKKATKNLPR
jgi:hypothetical protein